MSELVIAIIAVAGIVIVGLALTAIDVIEDIGKIIGIALLAFVMVLLIGQLVNPGGWMNYFGSGTPSSDTAAEPDATAPSDTAPSDTAPTATAPTATAPTDFGRTFSDWVNSGLSRLDSFVYGGQEPNLSSDQVGQQQPVPLEQPADEQPADSSQDVPSRVSRITTSAGDTTSSTTAPAAEATQPAKPPVPALW